MPGMNPLWASSRRQIRHKPNLRYTARGRPQRRQRVYSRVLYLAGRAWRTRCDVFAMALGVLSGEGHAERQEQREGALVVRGGGRDRHVQATDLVDGVVVDLREDDLLAHAERVVAASVERGPLEAAEVADARDRDRQEAIEELVSAIAAQRHGQADGHALAQLEVGDRLARAADVRLLAGDRGELLLGGLEHLGVLLGVADAHVERDLLDLRDLHDRRVAEALLQRGPDLLDIALLQT